MNKISSNEKLAIGICLGLAIGTVFDNIGIGLALGVAFGAIWGSTDNKDQKMKALFSMLIFVAC